MSAQAFMMKVVSYRNSTSNHNSDAVSMSGVSVVSYRNSTSNHNNTAKWEVVGLLYLIEILHQTTTLAVNNPFTHGCILSKFYIKPQRLFSPAAPPPCCILSKFYIKPQPMDDKECLRNVVSYRNSTSNHNFVGSVRIFVVLYLIEILHQTTTQSTVSRNDAGCILSKFYIKPQPFWHERSLQHRCILSKFYIKPQPSTLPMSSCAVVSYRNSTSNHNGGSRYSDWLELYLIEILHQTTTPVLA